MAEAHELHLQLALLTAQPPHHDALARRDLPKAHKQPQQPCALTFKILHPILHWAEVVRVCSPLVAIAACLAQYMLSITCDERTFHDHQIV